MWVNIQTYPAKTIGITLRAQVRGIEVGAYVSSCSHFILDKPNTLQKNSYYIIDEPSIYICKVDTELS